MKLYRIDVVVDENQGLGVSEILVGDVEVDKELSETLKTNNIVCVKSEDDEAKFHVVSDNKDILSGFACGVTSVSQFYE